MTEEKIVKVIDADDSSIQASVELVGGQGAVVTKIVSMPAVTIDTTGLATSAKQDTLLTELQLKADLTETQPVSIATMPSTPVTGTFWQATQPVSGSLTVDLGLNNDVTVTGSVTANAGTNLNTSLLATEATLLSLDSNTSSSLSYLETLAGAIAVSEMQVDVLTMPTVTVDLGLNNDVTVTSGAITETNSGAIKTAVEIIDNAIAGTEMQVDVLTMPIVAVTQSGTWDEVGINDSGNSITVDGAVTVTNATATNLKAEVVGTGTFAVQSTEVSPTTIYNGINTVATAGTQEALASSQAVKSVTIKALSTNTGLIYVGDSSVSSTTGLQLSAGDSVSLDIANLATVYIDSAVNGEGVSYLGIN